MTAALPSPAADRPTTKRREARTSTRKAKCAASHRRYCSQRDCAPEWKGSAPTQRTSLGESDTQRASPARPLPQYRTTALGRTWCHSSERAKTASCLSDQPEFGAAESPRRCNEHGGWWLARRDRP